MKWKCDDRYDYGCTTEMEVVKEEDLIEKFSFTKNSTGKRYPRKTCKACVRQHTSYMKKHGDAYSSKGSGYARTDYPGGR